MSPEEKRRLEKKAAELGLVFTVHPPSSTREGNRIYQAEKRKIQALVKNPAFRREFIQQYNGFADFLKNYDLNVIDLKDFLNMDMRKLVKRLDKKINV